MIRKFFSRFNPLEEQELAELEYLMTNSLRPVSPRPEFVSEFKRRLLASPCAPCITQVNKTIAQKDTTRQFNPKWAVILAGVFSGAMLFAIGIKFSVSLLVAIGLLSEMKRQLPSSSRSTA